MMLGDWYIALDNKGSSNSKSSRTLMKASFGSRDVLTETESEVFMWSVEGISVRVVGYGPVWSEYVDLTAEEE